MQDLWWQLQSTDSFTVYVAMGFALAVCWFIYEIVGSPMLACVSAPVLLLGGILSPTLLGRAMITLSYDRTINSVAASAIGTLFGLFLMLLLNWLWTLAVEYRVKRTKLVAIPTRASRIRR
ncbi:hypothetical protein [Hyphomicrobium sp.]|uniref:hypothetical protein n=1 Tax=Hyphomicrobium sp. TaxID=82 RepID=UPI000F92A129|nr:hypothetical protein [Hyphomicrobium sp.]RUO98444.1 MAG: hypothetical protein EKK30_11555 [Hyphomicrobium sp.]